MVNNLFITSVSKSHTVSLDSSQVQGNKQFNIHYSPIGAVTILLLYDKAVNKKTIIFFLCAKTYTPIPESVSFGLLLLIRKHTDGMLPRIINSCSERQ